MKLQLNDNNILLARGQVFIIDLEENRLPRKKEELLSYLLHKEITINKHKYKIIGLNFMSYNDTNVNKTIGLLVDIIHS